MASQLDNHTFDLRALNVRFDRSKRRMAFVSLAFIVLCLGVILFLVTGIGPKLANGSATTLQLVVLAVGVAWLSLIIGIVARGLRWKRRGLESFQLDSSDLVLRFPNRAPVRLAWSDPALHIELRDYGEVSPAMSSIGTSYFLTAAGIRSALSQQAFGAILGQVRQHGLVDRIEPASRWFSFPKEVVHIIRAERRT